MLGPQLYESASVNLTYGEGYALVWPVLPSQLRPAGENTSKVFRDLPLPASLPVFSFG